MDSQPTAKESYRVLLIDDDEGDATLTRYLLRDIEHVSYSLEHAATYEDGKAAIQGGDWDAILLDYRLGAKSGIDLVRELGDQGSRVPVILLTGQGDHETDLEAMRAGAADYLVKGEFDSQLLERAIRYSVRHARTIAELEEKRAAAEAANVAKSRFLAVVSHELRTPLTIMLGYAEILGDTVQDEAQRLEAVKTIRRSGEHLLQVINDVIDMARIEAGKVVVERQPCSPAEIVETVRSEMLPTAEGKGLRIETRIQPSVPTEILSDGLRIRQVVLNLVSNAVKFTDSGSVTIDVRTNKERLEIDVSDTGIGISPEEIDRLFQPFSQIDDSMSRRYEGAGLGLSISARLVELLGGTVDVTSEKGVGTRFRLRLPMEVVFQSTPTPDETQGDLHGKILLVEDNVDSQRLFSRLLRRAGLDVELAGDGAEGCEKALSADAAGVPFDLVFMDMQMPGVDGYEATERLRRAGYQHPIVALTAHALAEERARGRELGCDGWLSKPVRRNDLLAVVGAYARPTVTTH